MSLSTADWINNPGDARLCVTSCAQAKLAVTGILRSSQASGRWVLSYLWLIDAD
jgi:hypothetical protein